MPKTAAEWKPIRRDATTTKDTPTGTLHVQVVGNTIRVAESHWETGYGWRTSDVTITRDELNRIEDEVNNQDA